MSYLSHLMAMVSGKVDRIEVELWVGERGEGGIWMVGGEGCE